MDFIKTLSDTFQALASNVKDRVTSPIGGTFLAAWIVVNWKLVYYFTFNDDAVIIKIAYITKNYSASKDTIYLPVFISIGYILFYPTLANFGSFVWAYTDQWSKRLSAKYIERKTPLYEHDRRNILNSMKEQAFKFKEERQELKNQIESLNAALTNFENSDESKVESNKDESINNDSEVSPEDLSSDLLSKFDTTKGEYLLKENIANLFFLEIDSSMDKPELSHYCLVFKSVMAVHPSSFSPKNIQTGSTNLDINQVRKYLSRLVNRELLYKDHHEKNAYILGEKGKYLLQKMSNQL
jgi:predicted transcriptional regulator